MAENNFCGSTLAGIPLGCDSSMGGIKRVFIGNYSQLDSTTGSMRDSIILDKSKELIDNIEVTGKLPSTVNHYNFRKQTGSVETNIVSNEETGVVFYESTINLVFTKQETSKRVEIAALALGDLFVIVEDNNGNYFVYGLDYPVTLSEANASSGTAFTDFNGYNVTLTDVSFNLPYQLSEIGINNLFDKETKE